MAKDNKGVAIFIRICGNPFSGAELGRCGFLLQHCRGIQQSDSWAWGLGRRDRSYILGPSVDRGVGLD